MRNKVDINFTFRPSDPGAWEKDAPPIHPATYTNSTPEEYKCFT